MRVPKRSSNAFRKARGRLLGQSLLPFGYNFEFTSQEYNVSLKENTRNRAFVQVDGAEKIGVFLPPIFSKIKYKIVDGDKDKLFVANHLVLGDFAFLQITPEKGEILNRERKGHYELLVKATLKRKNANTLETTTKVNLRILDENDNNPMFRKVEYEVEVDTNTPLNARLLKLEAFDADEGLNSEVYYSMTNPLDDSVVSQFYIDAKTGWIRTFSELSPGNYTVNCFVEDRTSRLQFYSAQDSPKTAFIRNQAKAKITVKSAPEEKLEITVEKFLLRPFSKEKQLGAKIKVEAGREEVQLVPTGNSKNVWIEPDSDEFNLFVGRTSNRSISAEIQASEMVLNGKNISKKINLEIDPKRKISFKNFEDFLNLQVNESTPLGFVVYQFTVAEVAKEDLDSVKYRLRTEAKEFPFHLDRNTGQLNLKEKLDFEITKSYEFTVIAKLEGFEEAKVNFPVKVTVVDSNDNCPKFVKIPENFKVLLSSTNKGSKIFQVKATDQDSGDNGKVFYKLRNSQKNTNNFTDFVIDSETGIVTLGRKPEKKTKFWRITVVAFDAGFPVSLASEIEIEIFANSEDLKKSSEFSKISSSCQVENKHAPKFSKLPEAITVKEDIPQGTVIGKMTATDADYGINGIVQFSTSDEYFEIDTYSGEIQVGKSLVDLFDEFNKGQEVVNYQLEITVSDMGGFVNPKAAFLSTKSVITIRIQDVNNFSPEFESENYFSEISENVGAGIELLKVKAVDRDPGQFGRVEYVLGIENDLISIDPDTGVVKTEKNFDRELSPRNGEFHFLLAAFDRADPSKFGFANLTIRVTDENDNAPKCLRDIQEFKVLEDAPRGQLIGCLAAADADEGTNAEIFFNLVKTVPKVPFRVDSASGCLFMDSTIPLSADRHSRYSFNVTVSDKGTPVLSSVCQVKLDLIKVNQNLMAPEFSEVAVEASVKENLPVETEVLQVKATDPEGKQVKYELVGGSGLGYFEIDEDSGMITTATVLDYEATPSYWLTVKATDTDEKPLSGYLYVLVRVLDVNDRAPLFEQPIYFVNVEENSAENKVILKLEAEDADGRRIDNSDGLLRFSIVKGNTQSLFHIDPNTGYLVTGKRHLDRETQKEHELVVRVCDTSSFQSIGSSLCADALVIVMVDDVNDNKPLFNTTTSLNVQVPADKIGFLTRIFANDADSDGPNSEIEYSFIGPLEDPRLRIDKYGRISTIEALPSGKEVHISVLARDNGEPRLNSSIMLTLEPLGRSRKSASGNHKPKFIEKDLWKELYVSDSDPVGVIVGLVRAEDEDNDPLWFGIAEDSENPNETFAFKSATGELILARSVNLIDPKLSEVKLSVIVSDGIAEIIDKLVIKISRSASAPRPEFEKSSDSLNLKSSSPVGMVLYTAKASFDESRTGISHPHRLFYSIHHIDDVIARDFLKIDPHSGQLILEKPLTSQVSKNFTVIVSAKVGSVENFLQLFVTKEDANENPPKFISKNFIFPLDVNLEPGATLGIVTAFDADKDDVSYSVISGNEFGLFSIDSKSGGLKIVKTVPNIFKEAILTLRVTDSGDPQKSSTSVARIFLQQTTKTVKPVFESESLQLHVSDETRVGSVLTQARLIPGLGSLQTSIVFDGFCEFFDIHFVSGVIRLKKGFPMKNMDWAVNCTIFALNEGGNNATIGIHVKVLSTFFRSVRFSSPVVHSFIEENATPGSSLYSDSNQTSPLSLEVISASGSKPKIKILSPRESHFSIDPISGGIRLTNPLDYEVDKNWEFYVTSSHLGAFPHLVSAPALVKVAVGNLNDVSPNFPALGEKFEVLLPPIEGTKIGKLKAEDKDENDVISYGLKSSEFSKLFFVNRTSGDLMVATNKSSDFKNTVFMLPVVASDGVHSASTNVKITVIDASTKDVPINRLRFSQTSYKISLLENSTTTSKNLISFELENTEKSEVFRFELLTFNPAFELLETAGILRIVDGRMVDRELTPVLELLIKATSLNNPARSATTVVTVEVQDINDSAPEFLNLPFEVLLSEDATSGDRLISVKAKDTDLGTNSVVRYSLATDAPRFLDINKFDGRITLNSKPNLKTGEEIKFTVIATDSGKPALEARESITVKIANKHQPIFTHNRYYSKISESAAVGSSVISVRATSKSDGVIGYRIQSGDEAKYFSIDFNSGLITVNKHLDKEEKSKFKLMVEAIDVTRNVPGLATVEVEIEDVNDSAPVFDEILYYFEVLENLAVGSLIGQVKANDSEGSSVVYSIVEGNKTVVTVDPNSGMIHLTNQLDREKIDFYEFTVIARDQDRHSSEAVLQLKILDVNDNPPKFLNKNPIKINLETEKLKLNQFIFQLSARDEDLISSLQNKKKFIFNIVDGDETLFQIDPFNGVLRSSTGLSSDNLLELSEINGLKRKLNISVSDGLFMDFITVEIFIKLNKKIQTSPLHFDQTSFVTIIEENRSNGNTSAVLSLDAKGGVRPVKYSIPGKTTLPVTVEKNTGKVFVKKQIKSNLEIPIMAEDQIRNKAFSKLKIIIKDENDKEPVFVAPGDGYRFCTTTDAQLGESIAVVMASDQDKNDEIEYSLISSKINIDKYLQIDPQNGYITVKQPFTDIKHLPKILEFSVRASDSGNPPHSNDVTVKMKILDVPNVVPRFSRLHFTFAISEDSQVGKIVGQLQPEDVPAIHVRRELTFKLTSKDSENLPFSLDPKSGKIILKQKLDRETIEKYDFVVELKANDGLYSFALVTVAVMDVNDNSPVFATLYEKISIPEDAFVGTVLATFVASDADDGVNGHVSYSLKKEGLDSAALSYFQIDKEYGWLTLAKELDREVRSVFSLRILATDDSGKSSSTVITIEVEDVNDSEPEFDKEKYEVVLELQKTRPGDTVVEFNVTDEDSVGELNLFITSGDDEGLFEIQKTLLKMRTLPPEGLKEKTLEITASDGFHSKSVLVFVKFVSSEKIPTVSHCPEIFQELKISGNLNPGHSILRLPSGDKNEFVISHLLDSEKLPFGIKDRSSLVVKEGYSKKRNYLLKIRTKKEFKNPPKLEPSCLQKINLTIENANRMSPKFEKKRYTVEVKENVPVTSEKRFYLTQVEAVDDDYGVFGEVKYSILNSTGEGIFEIQESTGAFLLKKELDREKNENYEIFVKATDGGGLFDLAKIEVTVEDVNDNPPVFEKPVYRLKVLEDEAIGYELIKVKAVDKDTVDEVKYYLQKNEHSSFVELNQASGVIKLEKQLDYEKIKKLILIVIAKDNGSPALGANCTVEIEVLDVNDNGPRFERTLYEGTVKENSPPGTKVLRVKAVDEDSEHFGKVSYSISGEDSSYFDIDEEGNLLTVKDIDYETKNLLRINVKAKDGGDPPQSDDTLVSVTVIDENDNSPEFENCQMEAIVQEGAFPGHGLLNIVVKDKDSESSPQGMKLELLGDGADNFGLDQENRLIVIKKLNFEKKSTYNLEIKATDEGGKSTVCQIDIEVKKTSTHPPELKPLVITLNTLHGEFLGGIVGKVEAVDKDSGDTLRFNLVDSDDRRPVSKFHINRETGELIVDSDLLPGLHRLNVSVTDGKFTEYGRIDVDVANIDQDALDHAVSLRLKNISGRRFIKHFMRRFHEIMAHLLGVPITDLRFLSIQEVEKNQPNVQSKPKQKSGKFFGQFTGTSGHHRRHRRADENMDLDILFTVSRGENHGYHRPPWVRQNIEKQISELSTESGLEVVSLTSEVCRRDVCVKGECRDRLWMDNAEEQVIYEVDGSSFVSPKHLRTFECLCRQGFAGRNCGVPINVCSKELCTKHEMCIPSDDEPSGFRCVCPPGFKGSQCSEPTCDDPSTCSQKEELSLMGNGYVQLFVANSMETRLELSVQFRTVSSNAVLMHGEGLKDFHSIRISNGSISYVWDCGSGSQVASIPSVKVDDGAWHEFKVARRGRHVRIVLDNVHEADSTSPSGSDVVNLFSQATLLTFGARVIDPTMMKSESNSKISTEDWFKSLSTSSTRQLASDLYMKVEEGMIGCLGRISFDGFDLSKTAQGMRLFNSKIGCDTTTMGPCLSSPCANGGQCIPSASGSFTCNCPKRYTGANCEIDLNACESKPCPNGIVCHNLYNDFHCSCPPGFTGKTCQMRGDWDPCITNPCGPFGNCIRQGATFICNCSDGFGGAYCNERIPNILSDGASLFNSRDIYIVGGLLGLIFILSVILIFFCRKSNKTNQNSLKKGTQFHDYDDPLLANPLIPRHGAPPVPPHANERPIVMKPTVANAPPLPPRVGRNSSQPIYCNQQQTSLNLPTVEVRPMLNSSSGRFRGDSCSPSSSNGKKKNNGRSSSSEEFHDRDSYRRYAAPPGDSSAFSSRRGSSSGANNADISSSIPLLSKGNRLNDSIQCLETTEEIEIILDDPSEVEERNRMLDDLRRDQEKLDSATSSYNREEPQDYVTMKPIHKIKPFTVSNTKLGQEIRDIDEDSESRSKDTVPPPPPAHRTIPKSCSNGDKTTSTKIYDNPNDDTLSNITSNGLDD